MGFLVVLEWFTVVVTILVTVSGFPACLNMYRTKSTQGVPFVLFLIYAFVATLCLQYGLLTKNMALMVVNAIALLIWVGYISLYFLVTKRKYNAFIKASAVFFMYWAHLQYLAIIPVDSVLSTLGLYILFWCTMLAVLPCSEILDMIKTKRSDCCDMNMLYATTLNACTWILYGILVNDVYIWLPSVPALVVNIVKFGLIIWYSATKPKKMIAKPQRKVDVSNGHISTDFHEQVYKVRSRNSLHKGIQ